VEPRDLIIGPVVLLFIYAVAWIVRPRVSNAQTRKFFFPALTIKLLGAIFLGLIYQFYYSGGDTFTYFTHGAKQIYEAFYDDPSKAISLIFGPADYKSNIYQYASKIWMYRDQQSYIIVRIAGFLSLFTGGTYIGTSFLFVAGSFTGLWAMYLSFCRLFPGRSTLLALAILFIPSTVFWGSGILKDTVTFGMLGWSTAAIIHLLYGSRRKWIWALIFIISMAIIYWIKTYIVLSFLPAVIVWIYLVNMYRIRRKALRLFLSPFILALALTLSGYAVYEVGKANSKYAIDKLTETVRITAYDIGRWTGRNAGSRYDLGDLDGTFLGMVKLTPAALNVALFRPYLWEVNSPLMLIAALEGLAFLIVSIVVVVGRGRYLIKGLFQSPAIVFCLIFSLTFAFAVGISTYNFGTLFRYKVPLMPYFALVLVLFWNMKPKTTTS